MSVLREARKLIDDGEFDRAQEMLNRFREVNDPEVIYLTSLFSLNGFNETHAEFEQRYVAGVRAAADLGQPEAKCVLADALLTGDFGLDIDETMSARLFKEAACSGFSEAKLRHGLNLIYGVDGCDRHPELGLDYLLQAVEDGVEGARSEYEFHKSQNIDSE